MDQSPHLSDKPFFPCSASPVAYAFGKDRPSGWVLARATTEKIEFELRSLNPAHEQHGQKHVIAFG
jgi:Icc protein